LPGDRPHSLAGSAPADRSAHAPDRADRGDRHRHHFAAEISGDILSVQKGMDRLPLSELHGSHADLSLADQTVKTYIGLVAVEAAPYLLPRTRFLRHRT